MAVDKSRPVSLKLDVIRVDGGTQARAGIDAATVATYAEDMIGDQFPPVVVFYDGQNCWLADGFHRVNASKAAGFRDVLAIVLSGTRRDAVLFACGANAAQGLRRTNEDKRRAVETLLRDPEWAKWSDREIARACKVDHKVVSRLRSASGAEPQSETRTVTRNGTTFEQKAKRPTSAAGEESGPVPAAMHREFFAEVLRVTTAGVASKRDASRFFIGELAAMLDEAAGCWKATDLGDEATFFKALGALVAARTGGDQ